MLCSLSNNIDNGKLSSIKTLEGELGTPLLAFSCHDLNPAALNDDQLKKVKALESELGLVLVAVQ